MTTTREKRKGPQTSIREGETHPPRKPPTQIKAQFVQRISEQFGQIVPLFSLKASRKQQERVCANCVCKLFSFGWVFFWGGLPSHNSMAGSCYMSREGWAPEPVRMSLKPVLVAKNPCFFLHVCLKGAWMHCVSP